MRSSGKVVYESRQFHANGFSAKLHQALYGLMTMYFRLDKHEEYKEKIQ